MVIDTSAIVAILTREATAARLEQAMEADPTRLVSAATVLEAGIVIEARYGPAGGRELDLLLHVASVEIVSVTPEQAAVARAGWRRYGKGRHHAGLNYGDCFAYALAKVSGEPLLCTGVDFAQTDIRVTE